MKRKMRYYIVKLYIDGEECIIHVHGRIIPFFVKSQLNYIFQEKRGWPCSKIFYLKRDKKYSFFQRYKWYWHLKTIIIDEKERIRNMVRIYFFHITNNAINSLPEKQ
jgi:hypothetical protein